MRIQPKTAAAIQEELQKIAHNPKTYRGDWKRLKGSSYWRLRKGGWRAICRLDASEKTITVLKIGTRGDVYK